MVGITKTFPGVVANSAVDLTVYTASIHAVIGENGAGKSTLLSILYGRHRPDVGQIFIAGQEVQLLDPAAAIQRGIGLVSQHHTLIPTMSVLENTILGAEPTYAAGFIARKQAREQIELLASNLGLVDLDLSLRVDNLTFSTRQKIEIMKALFRGARILLLDEPTATLAPAEVDALFSLLRQLAAGGTTIVFVTHKLREVMSLCDRVSVLRHGRNAGEFRTQDTNEQELLSRMIGHQPPEGDLAREASVAKGLRQSAPECSTGPLAEDQQTSPLLIIEEVTVGGQRGGLAVEQLSLQVLPGEIVGVAGVDGSGQRELAEALVGLRPVQVGRIILDGQDITGWNVRRRKALGVAYIPEDRHHEGVILDFSVAQNYLLGHEGDPQWGGGVILNEQALCARTREMIQHYDVRLGHRGPSAPIRTLSGGNQQKVVVARAIDGNPRLVIACQPTRGLDGMQFKWFVAYSL
jgi:simple sugar transport system ATP-binding protein